MNIGIILGIATTMVAILFNYINLFCFRDLSNGTKNGEKIKHWLITYWVTWGIALIPFYGLGIELIWFIINYCRPGYKCNNKLFEEL